MSGEGMCNLREELEMRSIGILVLGVTTAVVALIGGGSVISKMVVKVDVRALPISGIRW